MGSDLPSSTSGTGIGLRHQYFAAFAATLGAFALGTTLSWTAPAESQLKDENGKVVLNDDEISWIGSLVPLGAMISGPLTAFLLGRFGRKTTMIGYSVPFLAGWFLMVWANDVGFLYAGRFITGFCSGAFSIVAPVYIAETAEPAVRGRLGTGFQIMVTIGIFFTYCIGPFVSWQWLSAICATIPVIVVLTLLPVPESPMHLLNTSKRGAAEQSLKWLRGSDDVNTELAAMEASIIESKKEKPSVRDFKLPVFYKPLIIALGLMFFQQFSGINAVIFYTSYIFTAANTGIDANVQTIVVGAVQVVATLVSGLLVDRAGRKILLIVSGGAMCLSLMALGVFFQLEANWSKDDIASLGWLPITSLVIFIIAFSLGYGPIPWMIIGELFEPKTKNVAASLASIFNWLLAFIITRTFKPIVAAMTAQGAYWFFSGICFLGIFFVIFIVYETSGKSLDEIQRYFQGTDAPARPVPVSVENGKEAQAYSQDVYDE